MGSKVRTRGFGWRAGFHSFATAALHVADIRHNALSLAELCPRFDPTNCREFGQKRRKSTARVRCTIKERCCYVFDARAARPCARCERSCSTLGAHHEDIALLNTSLHSRSLRSEIQKQFFLPARSCRNRSSAGAAHRQAFDFQRGLPNPNRNTLAFLAARAHAIVEPKVVPDHGDPC